MDKQTLLLIGIFILAFACLWVIYKKMKEGFGNTNLKIYGITIVVFCSLILAVSDVTGEKTSACYGILGAIAGYLFGLTPSPSSNNNNSNSGNHK